MKRNTLNFQNYIDSIGTLSSDATLLLVHHALPTHIDFFKSLSKIFKNGIFISIPYSLNLQTTHILSKDYSKIITPSNIEELERNLQSEIMSLLANKEKFVLIEVGGYSVKILSRLKKDLSDLLIGVVEDTENGHREHEDALEKGNLNWQVYSVARSPLKLGEDILTGDAIVFSLEAQLRKQEDILSNRNAVVLGFGKIGKGVAKSLRGRNCHVLVYDNDPCKMIEALALGYDVRSKDELLQIGDILIGCSGNFSIMGDEFKLIKNGSILASGSSKQKEFDLKYLKENYSKNKIISDYTVQYINNTNNLYLLYDGMPINFIDQGIIGNYIEIVWLEIIFILNKILKSNSIGLYELNESERKEIAQYWLNHYYIS